MNLLPHIRSLAGSVTDALRSLLDLLFPRHCAVCRKPLATYERHLCLQCYLELPRTGYHKAPHSFLETDYWGKIPIERAAAFFFYNENNRPILFDFKYHEKPTLARHLGWLMAREILRESTFFDGIDLLVPIPLHPTKEARRGYNQCHYLAQGISRATGIPVCKDAVCRHKDNPSQTRLPHALRQENVEGIFRCVKPWKLRGRHILIVDDVITTGATTRSCATAILQALGDYTPTAPNTRASLRISILSLAVASSHHLPMRADSPYTYPGDL